MTDLLAAPIISKTPLSGGCINDVHQVVTTTGTYCAKTHQPPIPGMFQAEAKGLDLLRTNSPLAVPQVLDVTEGKLSLEWVTSGNKSPEFWNDFAFGLSKLHRSTQQNYGLDHDNFIGELPQSNALTSDWEVFFIEQRLLPLLRKSRDGGQTDAAMSRSFDRLFNQLPERIPTEVPALIHGDLWSGNFMVNEAGSPVLIDPAVHYGHRESELAMTTLFGGFNQEFYRCYNEHFPLEKGWESRLEIHNLYPLLVHVVLFGGGYVDQVKTIVKRFA